MSEQPKHTPLPWVADDYKGYSLWKISENAPPESPPTGSCIANIIGDNAEAKANAEFIIRAVNCHDELVAALKGVLRVADRKTVEFYAAHVAIAQAEQL